MKMYSPFHQPKLVLLSLLIACTLNSQSQTPTDGSTALLETSRSASWHPASADHISDIPEAEKNSDTRYLAEFSARKKGNNIQLTWKALGQLQPSAFEVERSVGGSRFISIGKLSNTNRPAFIFVDKVICQPAYYYRIKIITKAGTACYSKSLRIDLKKGTAALTPLVRSNRNTEATAPVPVAGKELRTKRVTVIRIALQNGSIRQTARQAPIKFSDCLQVHFSSRTPQPVEVELIGEEGRIRLTRRFRAGAGNPGCQLDQLGILPEGTYRLCIRTGGRSQWFKAVKTN